MTRERPIVVDPYPTTKRPPGIMCDLRQERKRVTRPYVLSLQSTVRKGVVLLVALAAVASCTANGPLAPQANPPPASPSASPSPTPPPTDSPSPSPSPSPITPPSPVAVPAWAALHASCSGSPPAQEAVLKLQGAANPVLADLSNAKSPRTVCGISGGSFQPQLVTQTMISWSATQGNPTNAGTSVVAVLDLFNGASTVAATWSGGSFMDGLHAWSPDRGFLAYIASNSSSVQLHLLSGGGDRLVASFGAVPGRGSDPNQDHSYLAFSPDVWLYGHGGRSGGQLPSVRSSPIWLNSTELFYAEEAVCSTNCGIGPAWQPNGKTFTFDLAAQAETASKISQVYSAWPRPGQV